MVFPRLQLVFALAVLALALGSRAQAMTFETVSGPEACAQRACILASGVIEASDARSFATFIEANKIGRGALLILNSGGGNLLQSLKLGNEIRAAGLATTVSDFDRGSDRLKAGGICASACTYAFLGGVERSVGEDARIGVHQISSAGDSWTMSAADGLELMSLVATHVQHLCGNLDLLIPALKTRPQDMHWLSPLELTRYAVTTTASARG
jgi:hypothetical protein